MLHHKQHRPVDILIRDLPDIVYPIVIAGRLDLVGDVDYLVKQAHADLSEGMAPYGLQHLGIGDAEFFHGEHRAEP